MGLAHDQGGMPDRHPIDNDIVYKDGALWFFWEGALIGPFKNREELDRMQRQYNNAAQHKGLQTEYPE